LTSRELDPQTLEALTIVFTSIGGAIAAAYHLLIKNIKKGIIRDNRENLLVDRLTKVEQRINQMEEESKRQRDAMDIKLDKILESQGKLEVNVAFMKGKMETENGRTS
jgi:predicted RND superfamily exporter protein